ncbi:MAG: hypothetical protein GF411_13280 [Candidatus Lokiarchaeota archaeon]|nr:hypothetical protein [Candidatus Lokiarchaeota archaeon]
MNISVSLIISYCIKGGLITLFPFKVKSEKASFPILHSNQFAVEELQKREKMTVDIEGSTTNFDSSFWDSEPDSILRDFAEFSSRPESDFGFCQLIRERISTQPVCADTFVYLGEYYTSINEIKSARASYRRAIQLDVLNREAWTGYAIILEKSKEMKNAMKIWRALRYSNQTGIKDIFHTLVLELSLEE